VLLERICPHNFGVEVMLPHQLRSSAGPFMERQRRLECQGSGSERAERRA